MWNYQQTRILFYLCIFTSFIGYAQYSIPEIPKLQTSVYDYGKVLKPSEKTALENKLIHFSDSTSTQVVIITIESLNGEDIGILTPKWAQQWGIGGTEAKDNGVLILVAKSERKIWISPGYGVEQYLTAGINGEIIRNIIIPEFKAGSYYNGLDAGTTAVFEVLKGTYKGSRIKNKSNNSGLVLIVIIGILVFYFISRKNNGNGNNGSTGSGPDLMDIIILSSLGRSGGFGGGGGFSGSGSSGGFGGGFGGGGFSGGGAGGSW